MPKGLQGFQKGHKSFLTEESRRKIGEKSKLRRHTPEAKEKIRRSRIGKPGWMLGRKHTEESRKKMSEATRGKPKSEAYRQAMRERMLRNPLRYWLGKKRDAETVEKMVAAHRGKPGPWRNRERPGVSGEHHWHWKGGITPINRKIRMSLEYKKWRKAVFEKNDYTCVLCGKRGGELHADHIKPFAYFPEFRFVAENGRTLCRSCHRETDTYGAGLPCK